MNQHFLVKAKYIKEFSDGTLKRVTDQYLVDAMSFTEAEARIHKEIGEFTRGEFIVHAMAKQNIADIFIYDDAETWYKCKIVYSSEDADSGREKKIVNLFLLTAHSAKEADERVKESLKGLMATFEITEIKKTKIIEVFPYEPIDEKAVIAKGDKAEE